LHTNDRNVKSLLTKIPPNANQVKDILYCKRYVTTATSISEVKN